LTRGYPYEDVLENLQLSLVKLHEKISNPKCQTSDLLKTQISGSYIVRVYSKDEVDKIWGSLEAKDSKDMLFYLAVKHQLIAKPGFMAEKQVPWYHRSITTDELIATKSKSNPERRWPSSRVFPVCHGPITPAKRVGPAGCLVGEYWDMFAEIPSQLGKRCSAAGMLC
jgi:hypothetical protein